MVPASGQAGTVVTITGVNLRAYGTEVVAVTLAGVNVTEIVAESDAEVVVAAADGAQGTGDIVLTSDIGSTVTGVDAWAYLTLGFISSVSPASGREGTTVQISGVRLCGGGSAVTNVTLAGQPAAVQPGGDCGVVRVTAPDFGANVTGDVVLLSDTGAVVTHAASWTFIATGAITDVSPTAGQENTVVNITGVGLFGGGTGVSAVTLAGVGAFVVSATDTFVVVRAFPGPLAGALGDVVITGNTGSVLTRLVDGFTYSAIRSVEPASGQRGTIVNISGTACAGCKILILSDDRLVNTTRCGVSNFFHRSACHVRYLRIKCCMPVEPTRAPA